MPTIYPLVYAPADYNETVNELGRPRYAKVAVDPMFQKFVDWAADLDKRGILVGVDPLQDGGKTVRRRGAGVVIDGPYAEGREAVLGYYMVRVKDSRSILLYSAPHCGASSPMPYCANAIGFRSNLASIPPPP